MLESDESAREEDDRNVCGNSLWPMATDGNVREDLTKNTTNRGKISTYKGEKKEPQVELDLRSLANKGRQFESEKYCETCGATDHVTRKCHLKNDRRSREGVPYDWHARIINGGKYDADSIQALINWIMWMSEKKKNDEGLDRSIKEQPSHWKRVAEHMAANYGRRQRGKY